MYYSTSMYYSIILYGTVPTLLVDSYIATYCGNQALRFRHTRRILILQRPQKNISNLICGKILQYCTVQIQLATTTVRTITTTAAVIRNTST